jgi:hypothetical protein
VSWGSVGGSGTPLGFGAVLLDVFGESFAACIGEGDILGIGYLLEPLFHGSRNPCAEIFREFPVPLKNFVGWGHNRVMHMCVKWRAFVTQFIHNLIFSLLRKGSSVTQARDNPDDQYENRQPTYPPHRKKKPPKEPDDPHSGN